MQRRNFLKALTGALLTPLLSLVPKRAPDDLVIDWRDNVSVPSNWDVRDNVIIDVESFDKDVITLRTKIDTDAVIFWWHGNDGHISTRERLLDGWTAHKGSIERV